jgi:glycosyltransferase involved in cell wall biosynthesis
MHGWGIGKSAAHARQDLLALERANLVVTPSQAARCALFGVGLTRRDVRVIPYGIEIESELEQAPRARPTGEGRAGQDASDELGVLAQDTALIRARQRGPIALCIGTIGERKNQRLLVDALTCDTMRDVLAVFIGDGDPGPLTAAAAANGVAERVIVLGHRPHARRYLTMADALVLPSRNEGLPLAVLEALAAGVPVVGSALPEIREAVGPAMQQLLFAPDDPRGLARALHTVLHRADAQWLRDLARQRARRFSDARMNADYLRAYESLHASGGLRNQGSGNSCQFTVDSRGMPSEDSEARMSSAKIEAITTRQRAESASRRRAGG